MSDLQALFPDDFCKAAGVLQRYCALYAERKNNYLPKICGEDEGKELSEGNPINPIYKSRCSAIRVEQKRSTITAEFAAMALKVAKEYWQKAKYDDNYANGQFKMDMKRENLYKETDRRIKQK